MKLKKILIAGGPPAVVIGAMAAFRPEMLNWPATLVLGFVMGGFAALIARVVEPADDET